MKRILIVVDPQVDFTNPSGALAIDGAPEAFDNINKLLESDAFKFKAITQDWHPLDHVSFARVHGAEVFTKKLTIQGEKTVDQVMWPTHCVAGTAGAELDPAIRAEFAHTIFRKGYEKKRENYSFLQYEGTDGDQTIFFDMLANIDANAAYVCGYALDYCVSATAKSLDELFDRVVVVYDATKAVTDAEAALAELRRFGIECLTTEQVLSFAEVN